MQDVDLDLLRCFATVADLRNFTAAGARLGRSQSAVSMRIKKLEDRVRTPLFTRNNQDVQLTEIGAALLPKARRLLDESERLLAEIRGPAVSGRLRLGLLEYIAPHRLSNIMGALQRRLPGADLRFHVGLSADLKTALSRGEIDLALALHDPMGDPSTVVAEDRLIWVEGASADRQVTAGSLDVCLMQAPCIYRTAAITSLSRRNLDYREVLTSNSVQSVGNAVRSGMGVTVLGASCLANGLSPARHLEDLGPLPSVSLSLQGQDKRKAEVAEVLRGVLPDHLKTAA